MYRIICDGYILHDSRHTELKVIEPKCELEVNKTGALTFKIAPSHPYYYFIKKHTSEITLYQDDKVLFCGRVLNDEIDFENVKSIECEGELSYLLDSIQRPKSYNNSTTVESYLTDLINRHNERVDVRKQFSIGNVTVTTDTFSEKSDYEDTLTLVTDRLLNKYGGYLFVRHENNIKYIDYLKEAPNVCNQIIMFGENIVDMTQYIKGENIFTALIGRDKSNLTVNSVPNEVDGTIIKTGDYIYDSEAVEKYGWIWKSEKFDDTLYSRTLLPKMKERLRQSVNAILSFEMTAIDLHLLKVEIDNISVGDKIRCISSPHHLDVMLLVKSMSIDLDDSSKTKINLILPETRIIESNSLAGDTENEKKVIDSIEKTLADTPTYDDMDEMRDWVSTNFVPLATDSGGSAVDLTEYAKIVDVNNALDEIATALQGV